MEEKLEMIHELVDELADLMYDIFPIGTTASLIINKDGYRDLTVTRWDKDEAGSVETRNRREVFEQHRINGEWSEDQSKHQNDYYAKIGLLLREGA